MTFSEFCATREAEDWQFLISPMTGRVMICGCKDGKPASGKGLEIVTSDGTFAAAWNEWH